MSYTQTPAGGSARECRLSGATPRRTALVTAVLSVVGATGCAAQAADRLVVSSDPELARLAAELLPDLARRSGLELREPVRVDTRSREELVRYLEFKLDQELPGDEATAIVDTYALLGLVPADLDLRGVLMGLYTEQVAGFYEPDSTALFVMDDQGPADLQSLLVHELVHAVQDQNADLVALTDPDRGSDRATAAQAAIEGHATLVMFEFMAEQQMGTPVDLSRIAGFAPLLRQNLEGIRSQFPVLASAPRVIQETLIFPYLEGAVFLQEVWAGGNRVAPFGEHLPHSTEQILGGTGEAGPVELELEVDGAEVARENVLGALELGVLATEHLGAGGESVAAAWEGDRYVLLERPDGTRVLVSFVLWEDEAVRDRFVDGVRAAASGFGGPVRIEASTVASWPASILTVGDDSSIRVEVSSAARR